MIGPTHRRLPKWEPYDSITVHQEPRLKESGMSGDEWRTGVIVRLWFKGHPIVEQFYTNMAFAIASVPTLIEQHSCPIEQQVIDLEKGLCDQPGCDGSAMSRYRIKQLYSDHGEKLHEEEGESSEYHYRQFCSRHLYRGDCSREDCDRNYEVVSGPGPGESMERDEDRSPSAAVTFVLDSDAP